MLIKCPECGNEYVEYTAKCNNGCTALLKTVYKSDKEFKPSSEKSIFKFLDWLPCQQSVTTTINPVVYKSAGLGIKLGLANLFIGFNGYWPEKGAGNMTGTWKDFEALPTVLCFLESGKRSIILASAGNTARAFAFAATQVDIESFIIVPELSLERMWLPEGFDMSRIHLIALRNSRDYYKAIQVSAAIANRWNIPIEEGARNVARRDGMGTVMMEAAVVIGKLPDHYFQAVGSGTGGIANHESAIKLQKYDQFKDQPFPQLNLVQNAPFSPIYDAWDSGTGIDPSKNVEKQVKQIGEIYASVLANRNPPYNMKGGVRDVLKESGGKMHVVSNSEAIEAGKFFEDSEGIDITPAASVSVAALIKNIKQGFIKTEDVVLLNITGGGIKLLYSDYNPVPLKPELIIEDENDSQLDSFFMKYNHI